MDGRELVARRVSAACAGLKEEAKGVGLNFLAHILTSAVLEAAQSEGPPARSVDPLLH